MRFVLWRIQSTPPYELPPADVDLGPEPQLRRALHDRLRGHEVLDGHADRLVDDDLVVALTRRLLACDDLGELGYLLPPDQPLGDGNDEVAGLVETIGAAVDDALGRALDGGAVHLT